MPYYLHKKTLLESIFVPHFISEEIQSEFHDLLVKIPHIIFSFSKPLTRLNYFIYNINFSKSIRLPCFKKKKITGVLIKIALNS